MRKQTIEKVVKTEIDIYSVDELQGKLIAHLLLPLQEKSVSDFVKDAVASAVYDLRVEALAVLFLHELPWLAKSTTVYIEWNDTCKSIAEWTGIDTTVDPEDD